MDLKHNLAFGIWTDWYAQATMPHPFFKADRIFAFFFFESGLFEDFAQLYLGKTCGNQ